MIELLTRSCVEVPGQVKETYSKHRSWIEKLQSKAEVKTLIFVLYIIYYTRKITLLNYFEGILSITILVINIYIGFQNLFAFIEFKQCYFSVISKYMTCP